MSDIRNWNRHIRAEQAVYLLDACFSGLSVATKANPIRLEPTALRSVNVAQLSRPGHHIITAGTSKEIAIAAERWEGSLFTWAVLKGLRGAADASTSEFPKDGLISLSELVAYVKTTTRIEATDAGWDSTLTPQLKNIKSNDGEFFFITPSEKQALAKSAVTDLPLTVDTDLVGKGGKSKANSLDEKEAVEAQEILIDLGYNPGPVDGVMGLRTRSAIRKFQRDKQLEPSGVLDKTTKTALEIAWANHEDHSIQPHQTNSTTAKKTLTIQLSAIRKQPSPDAEIVAYRGGEVTLGEEVRKGWFRIFGTSDQFVEYRQNNSSNVSTKAGSGSSKEEMGKIVVLGTTAIRSRPSSSAEVKSYRGGYFQLGEHIFGNWYRLYGTKDEFIEYRQTNSSIVPTKARSESSKEEMGKIVVLGTTAIRSKPSSSAEIKSYRGGYFRLGEHIFGNWYRLYGTKDEYIELLQKS